MNRRTHILSVFLVTMVALILTAAATEARAKKKPQRIPFEDAEIFLELNDTDGDLGIHALIDGEPWKELEIEGPNGRELLSIKVKGNLQRQGLTEVFFESAEPSFDELPPEEFFRRFPEGKYEIEGKTLEGDNLKSTAELTHVLPAPADNIKISGHPAPSDCDAELPTVMGDVTITWDEVTASHPTIGRLAPIEIVGYQVVVEREEPSLLVFSVDLPFGQTEVTVPPQFIALGEQFKLEILAREAGGNRTAVETCFKTQ